MLFHPTYQSGTGTWGDAGPSWLNCTICCGFHPSEMKQRPVHGMYLEQMPQQNSVCSKCRAVQCILYLCDASYSVSMQTLESYIKHISSGWIGCHCFITSEFSWNPLFNFGENWDPYFGKDNWFWTKVIIESICFANVVLVSRENVSMQLVVFTSYTY